MAKPGEEAEAAWAEKNRELNGTQSPSPRLLKPGGLGGIMGGAIPKVGDGTKISVRVRHLRYEYYSAKRLWFMGFCDAATRFTKGQSPLQNLAVLTYSRGLSNGWPVAGGWPIHDAHENFHLYLYISTDAGFINAALGLPALHTAGIKELLQNALNFEGDAQPVKNYLLQPLLADRCTSLKY